MRLARNGVRRDGRPLPRNAASAALDRVGKVKITEAAAVRNHKDDIFDPRCPRCGDPQRQKRTKQRQSQRKGKNSSFHSSSCFRFRFCCAAISIIRSYISSPTH